MNKKQLQGEKAKLAEEKKVLLALKKQYMQAAKDVADKIQFHDGKITLLLNDWDNLDDVQKSMLQSQIYQRDYQLQLKKQIDGIIDNMNANQYDTVEAYLKGCYETGFLASMYDIQGQGIPIIMPIDQKAMAKAVQLDSKVSQKLYGSYVDELKARIQAEVSRGVASNQQYSTIARNLDMQANIGFNKAMRIARTEGHKIQVEAAFDSQKKAKEAGADIVKQWDSTLDGKTRDTHRKLDGQIRELDELFEVNGKKAKYPSGFGRPEEDINCRCALLQRARWALDDEELQTLQDRAKFFGLDKTEEFEDFKKKYMQAAAVVPVKKEYLTKKKLQANIADADKELDDLQKEFKKASGGWTYEEVVKDFGSLEDFTDGQNLIDLKILKSQMDAIDLQKAEWQEKLDKKLVTEKAKLLKKEQKDLQEQLDDFEIKTYSGIWKDDVTTADWKAKKGSVQAKKDYFNNKFMLAADAVEQQKWKDLYDQVDDFDKQGAAFYALQQKLAKAKKDLDDLKKTGGKVAAAATPFTPDAYGQRKDDAWKNRFKNKNTADQYYRPLLDAEWNNLSEEEKFAVWQYTHNSHPINRPLSGYNGRWGRSNFAGLGNVPWDKESGSNYDAVLHNSSFIKKFANAKSSQWGGDIRKYADVIAELTTGIEKSTLQDDLWLVRGSSIEGLAGLLESSVISYSQVENLARAGDIQTLKQLIMNEAFQMQSFTSTGIADGTGFGGEVAYKIYAPKGTKAIYAEPQSYYGNTISGEEIYTVGKKHSSVGGEAEVIVQRGTFYRITDVKLKGGTIEIIMEVAAQPDYFKTGYEHTFDGGLTSEK